jgi:hypothetical protein
MFIKKIELKFQLEVGRWASRNDLARSQDLRNNNQNVGTKIYEQLATSSKKQYMAKVFDKSKL